MRKTYKISLIAGATMLVMGFAGSAMAFHGGGVAHCDGCHSMHNSTDNPRGGSATSASLMKGSDASSTCLNCHVGAGGYHIASTDGTTKSQGGDFFWVKTDYTWSVRGNIVTSTGESHGHNIVASDFGFVGDSVNATAPGGTMNSATLGCTSCHDPHGQVSGATAAISVSGSYGAADPADGSIHGNFRLLGDDGFKQITAVAPVATSKNLNGSSYGAWTNYGTGMTAWCLSCHSAFNDNANMHPTNVPVPTTYNSYVKTGDMTGVAASAFDSLVPFERGVNDGSLLTADSTMGVEDSNDVVMCLTCHRAHGSAFENALRWDGTSSEYIAEAGIFSTGGTAVTLVAAGAVPYYEAGAAVDVAVKYGDHQRSLCNKCHAKD